MEQLLTYVIPYLLLQAFFINGIYLGSLGKTELLPDGSAEYGENLLYPLRRFLLKKEVCKIFYTGDALEDLLLSLYRVFPNLPKLEVMQRGAKFPGGFEQAVYEADFESIKKYLATMDAKLILSDSGISFYKDQTNYVYSKWLRKPIIQCVVCMASFWGLFTFLIPALVITGFNPIVIPAYFVNTVALAAANKLVFNLTK